MSLLATRLQDLRVSHPSNLDRDELRVTQFGLLEAVRNMTNAPNSIVSADLKAKAVKSQGFAIDVPVVLKENVTVGNTRSCTITGTESDSALYSVVWQTVSTTVQMYPAQYANNEIGYVADLAQKLSVRSEAMLKAVEDSLDTQFDTAKNQVYASPIVGVSGSYALTGNALQVALAQQQFFFGDIDPINHEDDFYSTEAYVIASPSMMSPISRYINQGGGNDANSSYQFAGKNFAFSNRVTNGAGKGSTAYFMPNGSLGLLTRVDVNAELGLKAADGTEWRKDTIPGIPFPVGVQFKSICADGSAVAGAATAHLKATVKELWEISFDYATIVPYNDDYTTKSSAIRKVEFLTS